ncbi:MAG: N-terminal double-transmembrane domain-containing protein [Candidatus Tokpelaia hoelldobleri]|uniref:N-terminal double-transmembrane domain-containing protein n=1 Tax=Candidatus Tokpelaia hoelldobleri TaxID=1902579 RepID=A0A1U9JTK3_9HYPH|nr:MAG: N-terminal double-transmembrane domain-containing protein [Candidatus Tokpelaia hoelldoblerii]
MALGFAAPLFLLALLALPALWWVLRLTPPRPQKEIFPPLRLLLKLTRKQETPTRNPWWAVLLRLAMAALFIVALAQPLWRPQAQLVAPSHPLVVMIDNSWAAAPRWQEHLRAARRLIDEAQAYNVPLAIIATVAPADTDTRFMDAPAARQYLDTLAPQALHADRKTAFTRLADLQRTTAELQLAYLTDGLATMQDRDAFQQVETLKATPFLWYQGDIAALGILNTAEKTADAFSVSGLRATGGSEQTWTVTAHDRQGRRLGETPLTFAKGEKQARTRFELPLELRNDIVSLHVGGLNHAGGAYLLGEGAQYRRIALLGPAPAELNQPLLAPLYYVSKALQPAGEIIYAGTGTASENIEALLAAKPAVLVMGDTSTLPQAAIGKLGQWIEGGGTLVRFAGPNLAASPQDDTLLPVTLRRGERTLGGALSWAMPQKIAPFPADSPFTGMAPPEDVTIAHQILAEPSPRLTEQSWITLADGTPLVTAQNRSSGRIVFIHTSAAPGWSNLPLSGFFVDMLQKIAATANQPLADNSHEQAQTLSPWRTLGADGMLGQPPVYVRPLQIQTDKQAQPAYLTPPGLYGGQENLHALNLFDKTATLAPLQIPPAPAIRKLDYARSGNTPLSGSFWLAALLLFALDCLLVLLQSSVWHDIARKFRHGATVILVAGGTAAILMPPPAPAQGKPVQLAGQTHLAYIITGNRQTDETSKTGLEALANFIEQRTTINPGPVVGLNPEKDELAFYPLLYWPMEPDSPMPSPQAIERISAYMQHGGTVLFDTRDQLNEGLQLDDSASPAGTRLRDILAGLDIPPLEPAPQDHVIARSFFLMPDFPGRYRGSPLWIAATAQKQENRLTRSGDGVSPILVTANDFAGAWAHDGKGGWRFRTVPDENMQRVWAFRGGLNIVMYMLSGNYKADQVHAPELLKRLGR